MSNLTRRGLLGAFICAPAIVRASSLMPVKADNASIDAMFMDVTGLWAPKTPEEILQDIHTMFMRLEANSIRWISSP